MPNGFHGTKEEWSQIEGPLKKLDQMLDQFAKGHNLVLTMNERNWPDRTFRWGSQPSFLIQVFLESEDGPTYTMWVSSHDERSREKYWKHKSLLKAAPINALEKQLPKLLESGYATAMKWKEEYSTAEW